jgi:hypothetical protein
MNAITYFISKCHEVYNQDNISRPNLHKFEALRSPNDKIQQSAFPPLRLDERTPNFLFEEFLEQIVRFLDENSAEHVVIYVRWDNVAHCRKPTPEELDAAFDMAVSQSSIGFQ